MTAVSARTRGDEELINKAANGEEAVVSSPQNGRPGVVHADVLRDLCIGVRDVRGRIMLAGAQVRGHLDLAGAQIVHPVRFRDCVFTDPVELTQARTRYSIEWEGGRTVDILADQFESESDLVMNRVEITGTVSLHWANVRGDLRFTDSRLIRAGGRAVNGTDARVGRTLFLDGENFLAEGEVCLCSAHVEGDVDCRHARFLNPSGYSINAAHLLLDGEMLCEDGFTSDGEVSLQWAQVQRLRATGGAFAARTAFALRADALTAKAGVYLDRGFRATAGVRLTGANITGELCCTSGHFENPSGEALQAERLVADDVYLDRGFTAHGEVRFTDAQVKRQFNATKGQFRNERGDSYALDADGLDCGGEAYLNEGFRADGAVSFRGASFGREFNCTGATFSNPGGYALFADGMTTPGEVFLDKKFRAFGEVRLARANVGRQLVCSGGLFDNQHGIALDLTGLVTAGDVLLNGCQSGEGQFRSTGQVLVRGAKVTRDLDFSEALLHGSEGLDARGVQVGGRLIWQPGQWPEGRVDLTRADISLLDDIPEKWQPGNYILGDMIYRIRAGGCGSGNHSSRKTGDKPGRGDRVPRWSVEQRTDWLENMTEYSAGVYRQLADSYRLSGNEAAAEKILIACQRHQRTRGCITTRSKAWNWFLGFTVGYGYRLHRVFLTLLILMLAGWIFYALGDQAGVMHLVNNPTVQSNATNSNVIPPFQPLAYSVQVLIPGLDLRETSVWLPYWNDKPWGPLLMTYTWLAIVIGWIAATAVGAGLVRLFRQR